MKKLNNKRLFKHLLVLPWRAVEITKNNLDFLTWVFFLTYKFSAQNKYKIFWLKKINTKKICWAVLQQREFSFLSSIRQLNVGLPAFDAIAALRCLTTFQGFRQVLHIYLQPSWQFTLLSKMPVWMKNSFALPVDSPQFSPQPVKKGQGSWKWLNISLFLGDLSIPDLWLKWDKPADPQVTGLH